MAARSIASGSISFGLVSIPVKLYTATQAQGIHFNMLDPETKQRINQRYVVSTTGAEIERGACIKGYEYTKGQFVTFTAEEMKALETPSNGGIFEIVEFVPSHTVDLLLVEKSMYVGPNKGGDKSYALLTRTLVTEEKYAVAKWISHGKEHLIVIRPYKDGLVAHQMYYADEVRDFEAAVDLAKLPITDAEINLARQLINALSKPSFDPSAHEDRHRRAVLDAIEKKVNGGGTIPAVVEETKGKALDLFAALQASLAAQGAAPAPKAEPVAEATQAVAQAVASVQAAEVSTSEATQTLYKGMEKPYKGRGYGKEALVRLVRDLNEDANKAAEAYGKPVELLTRIVEWEKAAGKLKDVRI
jgi:DNA end-binding protein Ku